MRSLFVRWGVAVVVGVLWGAVVPPARPRAEGSGPGAENSQMTRHGLVIDPKGR
jgi:hypothetical protein